MTLDDSTGTFERVAFPIMRPNFDNSRLGDFAQWFEDNASALSLWFELTAPYALPGEDDFFSFAADQHTLEKFK